jgi:hypothetical protein
LHQEGSMKRKKACSNCAKGIQLRINGDILCALNGPVTPDYVCIKHVFKPETRSFKDVSYKCIHCENFIIDKKAAKDSTMGLCRIFSVRQYDGTQRRNCSKFVKKSDMATPMIKQH